VRPNPVWISSKITSQALVVAQFAQGAQEVRRHHAHAALALQRLDDQGGGLRPDDFIHRLQIAKRYLVEARHLGAEAFQVFFIAAGIDRSIGGGRERPPSKADDMEAFGMAADETG